MAIIAAGGILVWSGIYNQSLSSALGSILRGQKPSQGPQVATSVPGAPGTTVSPGTTSSAVANDALKYVGSPYVWVEPRGPALAGTRGPTAQASLTW